MRVVGGVERDAEVENEIRARLDGKRVILRSTVGSQVTGTNLDDTDRDEMGVCVEDPYHVVGLRSFESMVYRTAGGDNPSRPGDLDLTIYGLRKFASLCLNANPTVLTLLYVPDTSLVERTQEGANLQKAAHLFASKRAARSFAGYMHQQLERLTGERGQRGVKRPHLVDAYGFDTKYAMHVLRLGLQGVEYLTDGKMTLPMREAAQLVRVRQGKLPLTEVLEWAAQLKSQLLDLSVTSPLPDEPDRDGVDRLLLETYESVWGDGLGYFSKVV